MTLAGRVAAPPEASNIQCFRDGRPGARLGRSRQEILDTRTLKAQHSCRFAGRSSGRLLIRRSLVRAQVGEPTNTRVSRLAPADFFVFTPRQCQSGASSVPVVRTHHVAGARAGRRRLGWRQTTDSRADARGRQRLVGFRQIAAIQLITKWSFRPKSEANSRPGDPPELAVER